MADLERAKELVATMQAVWRLSKSEVLHIGIARNDLENLRAALEDIEEVPPPLKIEAGKYYRSRDGRKAFVLAIRLVNPFSPVTIERCVLVAYESGPIMEARLTGSCASVSTNDSPSDLIAEWTD